MSRIIWCNNGHCAWNSRITEEPDEGEECSYTGALTLTIQTPIDGDIRDTMICDSYQAPPGRKK